MEFCCKKFKKWQKEKFFRYFPDGNHDANVSHDKFGIIARHMDHNGHFCSEIDFCPFCGELLNVHETED